MRFALFVTLNGSTNVSTVARTISQDGKATHWQYVVTDQTAADDSSVAWNESISNLVEEVTANKTLQDVVSLPAITSQVHALADCMPATGTVLDVYLWPPKPENTNSSDYVIFLGSLKRLKEWHNAKFHIFDAAPTEDSEFLQRFLAADFHISEEGFQCSEEDLIWRGKVSVCDKIENKGLVVSGVSLCRTKESPTQLKYPVQDLSKLNVVQIDEQGMLGRMFEVLDEVDLSTIPSFLRTPHAFQLCLFQKHAFSQVLMNYIQQNAETGLLARLAVYPNTDCLTTCGDIGLSAIAWKENIMADIQFVQEPEEDLQDNYEFLYFVITAPNKDSSAGNFIASVHLLQHPYYLSGSLSSVLYHNALIASSKGDNSEGEQFDLSDLPSLSADLMKEIENNVAYLQQEMLQQLAADRQKAGLSQKMPTDEVMTHLRDIRLKYFESLVEKVPKFKSTGREKIIDTSNPEAVVVASGSEWPERLIQQYLECQKRSLSRLQSCDSMLLSSPLQPNEASTTVDIQTLLKCFQPDGSAASDTLSPVRRRHSSRTHSSCTVTETNPQHVLWPDSKSISSHDVYYNSDKRTEKMNNHFNKIRDKYVKEETYSSCLATNVVFPKGDKSKKRDNPEPRRSPRKRTARSVFYENNSSLEERQKKRVSLGGRLSESLTPLATIHERHSQRRFSTPQPLPPHRDKRRVSSISRQDSRRLSDVTMTRTPEDVEARKNRRDSLDSVCSQSGQKESRSERHKRKLQEIVENVLIENGVMRTDPIFKSCSSRLFKVTKLFVTDLPTSRNLKTEMKKIAASQVKQVIEVDRTRQQSSQKSGRKMTV